MISFEFATCPSFWSTGYVTVDSDVVSSPDMLASVRELLNLELHCRNFEIWILQNFSQIPYFQNGFKYLDFAKHSKKYRILQN